MKSLSLPGLAHGIVLLLLVALARPAAAERPSFDTSARNAIVIDFQTGAVLLDKKADQPIPTASMSKIMTAYTVYTYLRDGKVSLDDILPVSEHAWRTGLGGDQSRMYVPYPGRVKVEDLLRGMIVQSGNDACVVLAEGLAGSEDAFVGKMNELAQQMGLSNSHFVNVHGLPAKDHYMSPRDLATLSRHLIQDFPQYYRYEAEKEFTYNKIKQGNRNPLLYKDLGADGIKTGHTEEAGYGLVGSAVQDGVRLIVVVNGLKSAKERGDEAKKLLEWGFRNFEPRNLFAEGQVVGFAKVYGGSSGSVPLQAPGLVKIMVPKSGGEKLIARIAYQGPVPAPVTQGQPIGLLKVWRDDKLVLQVPLKAAESVGKGNMPGRAFDAVTEMMIALFRAGAERL
jgi:D-alanyl-D-alanine carboxypeptidase (penicillin-binding protein 5/6)